MIVNLGAIQSPVAEPNASASNSQPEAELSVINFQDLLMLV